MSDETHNDDKNRQISMMEAAKMYGFSRSYLSRMAKKRRLKATRVGRSWITTASDVEDYIRSRRQTGAYREDIQIED